MKKVLVIAQFTQLPGEDGNNRSRFKYICEKLVERGYDVTEVTSSFRDVDKVQRCYPKDYFINNKYKIVILDDPGYKKNISLNRLKSQRIFSKNLKIWLNENGTKYDLIYCCNPPHEGAFIAGKYANKKNIPFVIDIQDLWPEAMKMAINIPIISDLLFLPMKLKANKVYSMADGIVAVSNTYLERAINENKKEKILKEAIFIGTDLEYFNREELNNRSLVCKNNDEFWITYSGSLSYSYDIETLIKAIKVLNNRGYTKIKLNILGAGPLENDFKELAKSENIKVNFTGWVSYGIMAAYLRKSDIVVNAIKKIAPQSITNKIGDYFASEAIMLNGSPNKELRKIVNEWECGKNYRSQDIDDLVEKILEIYEMNEDIKLNMRINTRELANSLFNRKESYNNIIKLIENLINCR